jgi:hypothetical protein
MHVCIQQHASHEEVEYVLRYFLTVSKPIGIYLKIIQN